MAVSYAYFTDLEGCEVNIELIQVVDDEFSEMVSDHPDVIGIPYCFNSRGDVWPKPSNGVKVKIAL